MPSAFSHPLRRLGPPFQMFDPLLSQLFTHMSEAPPRRSWLITHHCSANDSFWWNFCSGMDLATLFSCLKAEPSIDVPGVDLHLKGLA